ncbi:MAG: IPT/TIG domain-containing protein [Eubacterium aggregans]
MDCEATLGEGQSIYLDDQGNCVVKVSLGLAEDAVWADQIKAVYMDWLAAGDTDTPYLYASGTSMAAPMVTGGGAVAAAAQGMTDIQPTQADWSRLAKERAAWIKSHVTPYDSLKTLCATGGQLDLSRTDKNPLPVITGASLAPEMNPAHVTISGSHFGEEQGDSSVSIGWMTAKVTAWHENTITVIPDYRLRAGVLPVCVTTTAGSCTEGFLLEIPSQDNVPLFEKEIRLPQDISDNTMDNTLVGLGGDLYVIAQSQYTGQDQQGETIHTDTYGYGSYRELWRYRPNADTWTQCSDLPEQLDFLSATTWEGKLLVVGTTYNTDDQRDRTTLYSYNPEEDTWKAHGISGLPVAPAIINTENGLLLVGGGNASGMTALTENNIATLNMGTGTVTPVGTLHTPILNPKVALTSDRIFVAQGFTLYGGAIMMTKGMEAININGDYLCEALSSTLPKLEPLPESESVNRKNYGLTATAEGRLSLGSWLFLRIAGIWMWIPLF